MKKKMDKPNDKPHERKKIIRIEEKILNILRGWQPFLLLLWNEGKLSQKKQNYWKADQNSWFDRFEDLSKFFEKNHWLDDSEPCTCEGLINLKIQEIVLDQSNLEQVAGRFKEDITRPG